MAHAFQMFSQIGTRVVDRRADKLFDILLLYNHVSSLQHPDLLAKVKIKSLNFRQRVHPKMGVRYTERERGSTGR